MNQYTVLLVDDEDSQCDHIRHEGIIAEPSGLASQQQDNKRHDQDHTENSQLVRQIHLTHGISLLLDHIHWNR